MRGGIGSRSARSLLSEINRGGGIVDFANKDYQEHQPTSWNEQIDQLFKDGHITSLQAETEKLATAKQKNIITLFNNLFSSGFHLVETISF